MRRRVAAVGALIVVVLLLWWLISSIGGSDEEAGNTAASDAMATSTQPDMTSPNEPPNQKGDDKSPESSTSEKSEESESSEKEKGNGKKTCSVGDLKVVAQPGSITFQGDQQPNFYAKISNPTEADCVVDFSEDQLKFEVFTLNNYQRVWADLDCNESDVDGEVTIEPGKEVAYELKAWSRTTSAPEQCDNRQPVEPGAYLLYTHVGDNVSEPATFNLA